MIRLLAVVGVSLSLVAVVVSAAAQQPKGTPKEDNRLIGTWQQVSATYDGKAHTPPKGVVTVKHVTPTHFMDATYDKSGMVAVATGGTYTLKGEAYEETPE